jgi:hypothetical protein
MSADIEAGPVVDGGCGRRLEREVGGSRGAIESERAERCARDDSHPEKSQRRAAAAAQGMSIFGTNICEPSRHPCLARALHRLNRTSA